MNKVAQSIIIDREYGSGGREVARILSEKLGMEYYDGNLLIQAAQQSHIDLGTMKDYDEKRIGSILYNIAMAAGSIQNASQMEVPHKLYEAHTRLMRQLVAEKPCIFLGRCADEILRGVTPMISVFIYSDNREQKAKRIAKLDDITMEKAEYSLRKKDMQRANYYNFFTHRQWGDKGNYALCINTGKLSYEEAAEAIIALV